MKERLDTLLTNLGYFETKSKALAAIMAGDVKINGTTVTKAGVKFEFDEKTTVEIKTMPFVSRGGFKLDKAVKDFKLNLEGVVCLDAGASTGGFTDCMLQNGAKKVYAVDVGYGQIAWKLRTDKRVKVIEKTNIKNCDFNDIYDENDELPTFCATDLSFISIKKVLPNILKLMKPGNIKIVTLIKPQFEAGREDVGKNGVVRDKNVHIKVIENIFEYSLKLGLNAVNLTVSPIKGPAGNTEYLAEFVNYSEAQNDIDIEQTVNFGINA